MALLNIGSISGCPAIYSAPEGGNKKYSLLDRVKDDSNNEIGTVSGFFTDGNNIEYAVVCLDGQYRTKNVSVCSNTGTTISNLPQYANQSIWSSTETATFNTQKILDFCSANNYTSAACTNCRSKSFTIDGIMYYGQLPNIIELIDIFKNRIAINSKDPTLTGLVYVNYGVPIDSFTWSSSQYSNTASWAINVLGEAGYGNRANTAYTIPVIEIPNS
jgi:hypothetical protein